MRVFRHLSVKWKIYLIALVSIIGFGVYLAFNVWVNTKNAKLLSNVKETSFPILELANANRVELDRIIELLNNAVLTGEQDYIVSADSAATQIVQGFQKIAEISPSQETELKSITNEFDQFFNTAKEIAVAMSQGTSEMEKVAASVEKKEAHLTKFTQQLDAFISSSKENFSNKIVSATNNSQNLLTSGFIIWAVNILIIGLTVFTIAKVILTNINHVSDSLDSLASNNGLSSQDISVKSDDEIGKLASSFNKLMGNLREKTNDLMCMMHNMHQGLFTITENETIHREYSSFIEKIFCTNDVSGRNYADLLFSHAEIGSDTLNQVKTSVSSLLGSDEMMFEFNKHLLIAEYSIFIKHGDETIQKIIELDWDPIVSHGEITKIMVTARDVTELKIIQAAAEEQKKELTIIGEILKISPGKFQAFAENAFALLEKNKALLTNSATKNESVIADLFINMHTIKGNARTYNFSLITDVVHEAENVYDRLRKESDYEWNQSSLLADVDAVAHAIQVYVTVKNEKLNFSSSTTEQDSRNILITRDDFNSLYAEADHLPATIYSSNLMRSLALLDSVPIKGALEELIESLPSIAKQLHKAAPNVIFSGVNARVRREYTSLLNDVFTHLLRNSIDHGIEATEERALKGKPSQGAIKIDVTPLANHIQIRIADDGKGINLARLKDKALEAGRLTTDEAQDPQKIAECLFLSGISTAEKITAISGRGVGMDAVKKYLAQNDCDISIELDNKGLANTEGYAAFSMVLTMSRRIIVVE